MQCLLDGTALDEIGIERIRAYAPPEGYWLAFGGGKDSVVLLDLANRSGVTFEAHYNHTTVDPPELVKFVRQTEGVRLDYPKMSMWKLIRHNRMPPRRNARFCCRALKERGGDGRIVLTGVRWGESNRRSARQMYERCQRRRDGRYLHPIIDWTTSDVWEYIRERELPYCSLYDEGWKRLGCVLCPMVEDTERYMERWPGLCRGWEKAIKATWTPAKADRWESPEALWRWWLDRRRPSKQQDDPVLFEDDPSQLDGDGDVDLADFGELQRIGQDTR